MTGIGWSDWYQRGESVEVQSQKGQWVTARPDAQGKFEVQLKMDDNAGPGPGWVTAVYGNGSGSSQTFTVTAAAPTETVVITPDPVQAGKSITITGHGFSPGISVVSQWCFGGPLPEYPVVENDGSFTLTVTVPPNAPVGGTCINMPSHGTYGFTISPPEKVSVPRNQDPQPGGAQLPPQGGRGQQSVPPQEHSPGPLRTAPGQDGSPNRQGSNTGDVPENGGRTPQVDSKPNSEGQTPESGKSPPEATSPSVQVPVKNPYWVGYAVAQHDVQYNHVEGRWTQPKIDCTGDTPYLSVVGVWVGLGGASDDSPLVQVGTTATCTPTGVSYAAVWEVLDKQPATARSISEDDFSVAAGDDVLASVTYESNGTYSYSLKNNTTGRIYGPKSVTLSSGSTPGRSTAECIVERAPTQFGVRLQGPLPKFSDLRFSRCYMEGADKQGQPVIGGKYLIEYSATQNGLLAEPSAPCLQADQSLAFPVVWKESGVFRMYLQAPLEMGQQSAIRTDVC